VAKATKKRAKKAGTKKAAAKKAPAKKAAAKKAARRPVKRTARALSVPTALLARLGFKAFKCDPADGTADAFASFVDEQFKAGTDVSLLTKVKGLLDEFGRGSGFLFKR
jgi:hypothetical protein